MRSITCSTVLLAGAAALLATLPAAAQSFRVQCPTSTVTHPDPNNNTAPVYTSTNGDPLYLGPTALVKSFLVLIVRLPR